MQFAKKCLQELEEEISSVKVQITAVAEKHDNGESVRERENLWKEKERLQELHSSLWQQRGSIISE